MTPIRVLFVCLGNICRSPAAESVMRNLAEQAGCKDRIHIDSAGTMGYHAGNPSDSRIRIAGTNRGYQFDHLARQVIPTDFHEFDYIVAMDESNLHALKRMAPKAASRAQLSLLLSHCPDTDCFEVPDPYYGGPEGFERVLDLVEKGCSALLLKIRADHPDRC